MQLVDHLSEAIEGATNNICIADADVTMFLGMSGVSTDEDRLDILSLTKEIKLIAPSSLVGVDNDSVIGLVGGLAGAPGMALVAGTGSICLGVNSGHQQWWCGGWGALVDDAGSAPWVAVRALNAIARAEDGRGPATVMTRTIFEHLGIVKPRQLLDRVHNQGLERTELGCLAPLVVQAYCEGDTAAGIILNDAAKELSAMVRATVDHLFDPHEICPLIFVGGFARSGEPFQRILTERVQKDSPNVSIQEPLLSPALGAVLESMRLAGVSRTLEVINELAQNYTAKLKEKVC
jgi:N-acetylglucosamine kinase-like BadF-type ATPase